MPTLMTTFPKSTVKEAELLPEIATRKSLRAYSTQPLTNGAIKSLFEAARWAPSSSNEQPWVYVYATAEQPELHKKIASTLVEANAVWAKRAPLLIVAMVRTAFIRNGKPNVSAKYDLGAANAFLTLQATQLGLNVHQMGGFEKEKAIALLNIPETHEPVVVMAIGYPDSPEILPDNLKERELALRERYTQEAFVLNDVFPE
ncbi:MAG: nitroreductase family protein [Chryseotalea sp.]|jgi:nitroreductase|nr:nitroreductase family protein [Flammeovirgaceae bacterium]